MRIPFTGRGISLRRGGGSSRIDGIARGLQERVPVLVGWSAVADADLDGSAQLLSVLLAQHDDFIQRGFDHVRVKAALVGEVERLQVGKRAGDRQLFADGQRRNQGDGTARIRVLVRVHGRRIVGTIGQRGFDARCIGVNDEQVIHTEDRESERECGGDVVAVKRAGLAGITGNGHCFRRAVERLQVIAQNTRYAHPARMGKIMRKLALFAALLALGVSTASAASFGDEVTNCAARSGVTQDSPNFQAALGACERLVANKRDAQAFDANADRAVAAVLFRQCLQDTSGQLDDRVSTAADIAKAVAFKCRSRWRSLMLASGASSAGAEAYPSAPLSDAAITAVLESRASTR